MNIGDSITVGPLEMTITAIDDHGWAQVRFFLNDIPCIGTIQIGALEREHASRRGNDVHTDR